MKEIPIQKKQLIIASALSLALALGLGAYTFRKVIFPPKPPVQISQETVVETPKFRHPLTGYFTSEEITNPRVAVVVIDNSVEARPQSGVSRAFLVIEAPAEANIPRWLAFFSGDLDTDYPFGPVRSARPYFLDWASEFPGAVFAHVGGSPDALKLLAQQKGGMELINLDEFNDPARRYFWRISASVAPYNTYTMIENLIEKSLAAEGCEGDCIKTVARTAWHSNPGSRRYGIWLFDEKVSAAAQSASKVTVEFSKPVNQVVWSYDGESGLWMRSQGGKESIIDAGTISASNVAVVITDISILDEVGRRKIRTTGEGKAFVMRDGKKIEGIWKKPTITDRLRFYDQDGNEIVMKPGQTWIEVVGDEKQLGVE